MTKKLLGKKMAEFVDFEAMAVRTVTVEEEEYDEENQVSDVDSFIDELILLLMMLKKEVMT